MLTLFLTGLGTAAAVLGAVVAVLAFVRSSAREREDAIQERIKDAIEQERLRSAVDQATADRAEYKRDRAAADAENLRRRDDR